MKLVDKKIKAVLFDLGETLLSFGEVNIARLFKAGARLTYDFLKSSGQPVGNFKCYYWRNLISLRLHYGLSKLTGRDFDTMSLLKKLGIKAAYRLSAEQWQQLAWLWYEPLSKLATVETNIAETLTSLEKLGLKLGIISNTCITAKTLDRHLQQLGILDFFQVRLYSYEFDFRKPDARIFRAAAEKIGETLENILFVGDRIGGDIKAAAQAGMQAVLKTAYTNAGKRVPKGAWKINHLSELPGLIEKIDAEIISPWHCRG